MVRYSTLSLISLAILAAPAPVLGCEGECIVGITNAFLSNYTRPIQTVFQYMADQISDMIPDYARAENVLEYLEPILDTYSLNAYAGMETAIFPHYFHGKCQQDGVDPPGCPNPDCPVVCGTPGSLVHFYPTLRFIAFNQTRHILRDVSQSHTDAYAKVEAAIVNDATTPPRQLVRSRFMSPAAARSSEAAMSRILKKRAQEVKAQLRAVLDSSWSLLEKQCGGTGTGVTNGLTSCSWEKEMKEYILSFP
ncbi:hypothetical protein PUNSTDRAFT_144060 [Punctularia strigosozonata HHB-11173 SS5]|uniref:uncharacterized protein n=1 Tax=Punctularia strigosozonata (strain HHB-11173) TaxID=741275 RepID=UPI0004417F56|nr:uncharacterized protein PUNSTDRAFT_144060 [Punctularia strigosozonata HHB-11173 SS5]EIN08488.1 hypothetical protein PUNSTDRAFT_144060 [Punctularia strigosozonata HHB-11173 SS5]